MLLKDWSGRDSRFCKLTIGLFLLARFHYIIHCLPGELSQEQHRNKGSKKMD